MHINKNVRKSAFVALGILFFSHIALWLLIPFIWKDDDARNQAHTIIGATYGFVTLIGGTAGMIASRQWGGLKSYLGKALFFLSLGLFLTEFGQLAYSFYNLFLDVELPYPSIGDVGFVGAIPMYVLGSYYLLKTLNMKSVIKNASVLKLVGIFSIPLILSVIAYLVNFRDYSFDGQRPLVVFLDFIDPIFHVIYLSFTLLALTRSRSLMGGALQKGMLMVLVAFLAQYLADLNFLYQDQNGTWLNGHYGDMLYLLAYTLMSVGLISFLTVKPAQPITKAVEI